MAHRHRRARLFTGALLAAALLASGAAVQALPPELDRAAAILDGHRAGNRDDAVATLSALGEAGNVEAALLLARAFYVGHGLPRSLSDAIKWWQQAARHGNRLAAYNAGLLLLREQPHNEQAYTWLRLAADDGDALACFVLGTALAETNVPDHFDDARHYLETAAASAYAPAQFNLAQLLARSNEAADRELARTWLEAAAVSFAPARAALAAATPAAAAPAPRAKDVVLHELAWVLEQPPQHFTIQVAAGRSEAAIKNMLARHLTHHEAAWFVHRSRARERYSAIVGSYADNSDAQRALETLPQAFKANAPWIRRFSTLQHELARSASAEPPASP